MKDMNVLIVGETNEKLSFISELLGNTALKEKVKNAVGYITVKNSENFCDSIAFKENRLEIYSVIVPFGVNLFLDISEKNWSTPPITDIGMVLFTEGYPFTTDSLLKNLLDIESFLDMQYNLKPPNNICFRVMFHKERDRRFAAGDLVGIDEALNKAPETIKTRLAQKRSEFECSLPLDELIDFVCFSDAADIPKVFVFGRKAMKYTAAISRENFRKWQESRLLIDQEYTIKLMEYNDLTDSERIHDTTTKYEKVMGSPNIAEQYAKNYYKAFSERFYALAAEFYKEHIIDVCFWDIELDLKILKQRLDNMYSNMIHQACGDKLVCPKSREEYHNLCVKTKIGIYFSSAINEFVKSSIANLVKKYLDEKESTLSGIFQVI